jgi:hypothetical protein
MKTRWITWLITISAFIDTVYGVIAENSGLLAEIGVSPKVTKVILALGILWTAFSKSLVLKPEPTSILGTDRPNDR